MWLILEVWRWSYHFYILDFSAKWWFKPPILRLLDFMGLYEKKPHCLTHWGRDKMVAIFQTTFSNGFSWMKMYEFRLTLHWSLFLGVQLTIFQHWFRYWLGANLSTSHYLIQWLSVYWRIYASLGLNDRVNDSRFGQLTYGPWAPAS